MSVPNFLKENTELKLKKLNKVDEFGTYFSIPFVTDVHNAETTTYKWLNSIKVIEEVNKRKNINYVLTGGDYINNHENKEEVINRLKNFKDRFEDKSNVFITLGNHDDNSNYKDFSKVITHAEMKELMFSDMQDVNFGNGLYYYKDFHNYKIRLIVLNSEDIPEYDIGMKYKGQWDYAFSDEQLNWVAHTALNTEYKIIFCSHTPMLEGAEGFDYPIRNVEAMLGIMKAYTLGESYSGSNTTGDFKYNVSVNYNKKGTIVCCLFGHVHADNIVYRDNIAHISTTCSNCSYRYGFSHIENATGTVNEIALDFLTVGRKTGYLTRFGAGEDRTFSYINNSIQDNITNNQKGNTILQLFDKEKNKIAGLVDYENLCIESVLDTGDKTLSFYYSFFSNNYEDIEEETYIRTKTDEYVVKAKGGDSNDNKTLFTCKLNVEELEGTIFDRFESVEQNLVDALNLAIVGTGWRLNSDSCNNRKKRTIRMTNCSSWTIIQKAKKLYDIEFKFDTLNKVIMLFDRIGEDRGVYFTDSLNLKALQVQGNSYGFYTRIIPIGKDGLTIASINGGKLYLENKQYSNKTLTYYWKDERYTKQESLKEDALEKLNIMSKPFKSYIASTINLAEMNEKYKSILDYNLGDYIYLVSKKSKVKDKHRIVKTKEYPQDHSKDSIELANKALDLSEEKLLVDEMNITLDNVTTDNGTLNGSTIDSIQVKQIEDFKANVIQVTNLSAINADIQNLRANKADIQDLNAVKARIGTLEATKADITQLTAVSAEVQQINAIKANITDLNAVTAKIGILESKTASIDNLLAGNLTADNFKANSIVAGSAIIAENAIGSSQISSLTANKITTGTIDTSLVTVAGPNGRLRLQGNKLQIFDNKDGKLYERIMLGVDSNNNSSLVLRGADGRTVLLNQDGLTKEGLTDGFNKIDDNSIDATRVFDKNSLVRNINGATETIRGTRVQIGDRTLDVELGIQSNTITEQGKVLDNQKATITALQDAIKLKVDNQTFTSTTQTINRSILEAKEEAKSDAKAYSDTLGQQLKANAEKYANDVAIAKAELAKQQSKAYADGVVTEEEKKRIKQAEDNLNTAIAKANEAENKAREYADAKKIEAINKASADAALKAAEALNSAKAFTTAEINTTNSNLHKATAEINILKNQIESKVSQSDIDKSIQEIKIGGRNLVLNSDLSNGLSFFNINNSGGNGSIELVNFQGRKCLKFTNISSYRVSKYLRFIAKGFKKGNNVSVGVDAYITDGEGLYFDTSYNLGIEYLDVDFIEKNKWIRLIKTSSKTTDKDGDISFALYGKGEIPVNGYLTFFKVEEGNKSTDWTPAPEDTDQLIVESQNVVTEKIKVVESNLTQTKNSIEASVRDLDSQTKAITTNVTNINNDLINKINAAKGDAINKAKLDAKDYTNAQISTVNTKVHNVESNLNILKNKIESKVSQSDVDKSISEIKIGGRNLLLNSKKTVGESSNREFIQFADIAPIIDKYGLVKYTISFDLKSKNISKNNSIQVYCQNGSGSKYSFNKTVYVTTEYKRYSITVVPQLADNSLNESWLAFYGIYDTGNIPVVRNVKIELGELATDYTEAPEDVNKLVVDSIKVVDTKISDVSTKITQLKDSVTIDINSINSKTHTIETNLGGKASKEEVTEVNNRVATIKANLDSITQRVSSTESKTHTLETNVNGKASKQELTVVNNKVTEVTASLNGITQRVGNAESRINTLDGKVANAVTMQQFTEFKQTNNKFVMDLASSGGCNLVKNSAFESQDWRNWSKWGSIVNPVVWMNNEQSGHKWACKITTTGQNQGIQQQITGLEFGKVYTVTMKVWSENGVIGAAVRNAGVWNGNHFGGAARTWGEVTFTFEAKEITTWLYIGTANTKCTPGVYWVTGIQITQGNCKQPWSQHPNENYNTNFIFDNTGLTAKFKNNTHTKMTEDGFEWFDANNMSHAYHCLMEVGIFNLKQYGNGNWTSIKIQLPAYFRNKYFKAIAFPAGYSTGQTNLDTLTIQVQSYDIANATFTIQAFAHSQNGEYQNNINIAWMATA
ncbi:phage tail spike protein [Clostridium perfringens]|uniref:KID repeat family protein n=1 Tax=Clostridium perfringens E str. JGS1987 TaxID=451755 RepID=B1BW46_CLOPF|nr:phage tail spike protein [Clostridium perfringens]EDT14111.1 KID repeat family protein [Clostridium perfringens E str. JGS1987]